MTIPTKMCWHPGCQTTHKSEGDYCAEHAADVDRPRLTKALNRYGQARACGSPHLAEEEDFELGIEWSLKRNVL